MPKVKSVGYQSETIRVTDTLEIETVSIEGVGELTNQVDLNTGNRLFLGN